MSLLKPVRARRDQDQHQQAGLGHTGGRAEAPEAHPLRPHRRTEGRRNGRGLARIGRLGLRHRHDALRRRRHDTLPGFPREWLKASVDRDGGCSQLPANRDYPGQLEGIAKAKAAGVIRAVPPR